MTKAEIYIVNMETGEKVRVMFVPLLLEWESTSNLAPIATLGRNNPFYHYTGGEDKLSFELDWLATDKAKTAAINACNKLKSWSKNNSYKKPPPRIKLIFGTLFSNHIFLIADASYNMAMFQGTHRMLPAQCYQTIELVKITSYNETHKDISDYIDPSEYEKYYKKQTPF